MKTEKFDKQKLLTAAVTCILLFFFIGGFLIGLNRVQSMEGTFPPNELKESLSEIPETKADILSYIDKVFKYAKDGNERINYSNSFSVDEDSLATDGTDEFKSTLLFAVENFENHISSAVPQTSLLSNFGTDTEKILRLYIPSPESIKEVTLSYIYYSCPSCGESNNEQLPTCELCGSHREYQVKYRDEYTIELIFDGSLSDTLSEEQFSQLFLPRTDKEISSLTDDGLEQNINIERINVSYKELKVNIRINRFTDELLSVRFTKSMDIDTDVAFINNYETIGKRNITFVLHENTDYNLTWPSLSLNAEKLVIEPKKSDNLLATLTCEDPLSMTVNWTSSDESVATVDNEGYIHATKNAGETIITASYQYLGKTYSDSCTVFVRVPVESMRMVKKSVALEKGEQVTLETKISPSSATVKTVKWYSEDESIATVDENGVVTAVAQGEVIVYALSDDGYYRSTCEVTVE